MNKTDKINKEIAELEYKNYSLEGTATTIKKYKVGKVIDVNNNRTNNGEQIYAIASGGTSVLPDAPLSERQQVKVIEYI